MRPGSEDGADHHKEMVPMPPRMGTAMAASRALGAGEADHAGDAADRSKTRRHSIRGPPKTMLQGAEYFHVRFHEVLPDENKL